MQKSRIISRANLPERILIEVRAGLSGPEAVRQIVSFGSNLKSLVLADSERTRQCGICPYDVRVQHGKPAANVEIGRGGARIVAHSLDRAGTSRNVAGSVQRPGAPYISCLASEVTARYKPVGRDLLLNGEIPGMFRGRRIVKR